MGKAAGWVRRGGRLLGVGLLAATGGIHLDLFLTGYRNIPTIGPLFMLQVIGAFVLAAALLISGHRLVALCGAGFAASTLGGYLLSVWVGLFGFKEVSTPAGIAAGIIEVALVFVLGLVVLVPEGANTSGGRLAMRAGIVAAAGVAAASLLAVAVASAAPVAVRGRAAVATRRIDGHLVLTTSRGRTLYWFGADVDGRSHCYGTCASYWPPLLGSVSSAGVPGTFSSTRRTDGDAQVTYDGHPLYTYVGDTGAGEANGNGLDLNGGIWHEVLVSS